MNLEETKKPRNKFELAIANPNLSDLLINSSELGFDAFLENGVLKEIPIVSTILSSIKLRSSIREYYTTKKLYSFLFQLKNVSLHNRLEKNKKYKFLNVW